MTLLVFVELLRKCNNPTTSALRRIQLESERTSLNGFRIEDEYFTGILRQKAKIANVTMMEGIIKDRLKEHLSNKQPEYKKYLEERQLLLLRRNYHRMLKDEFNQEKSIFSHSGKRFHGEILQPKHHCKGQN